MEGKKPSQFIVKLIDMLQKYPQYIGWSQQGKELIIRDLNNFQKQILPIYFRHTKLSSLIRQFNMYNFSKKQHTSTILVFQHEIFWQGNQGNFGMVHRKNKVSLSKREIPVNDKFLRRIKEAKQVPSAIRQNIEMMLKFKNQLEGAMKELQIDLSLLNNQIKDSKSKGVRNLLSELKQSYDNLLQNLNKAQQIDNICNRYCEKGEILNEEEQYSQELSILMQLRENPEDHDHEQRRDPNQFLDEYLENQLGLEGSHFNI